MCGSRHRGAEQGVGEAGCREDKGWGKLQGVGADAGMEGWVAWDTWQGAWGQEQGGRVGGLAPCPLPLLSMLQQLGQGVGVSLTWPCTN